MTDIFQKIPLNTLISLFALFVSITGLIYTSHINKTNNFENLFFHLITLLSNILKINNDTSISETLNDIKNTSNKKLDETIKKIKCEIYCSKKEAIEGSLIYLENLELAIEKEKESTVTKDGDYIRKPEFLVEVSNLSEIYNRTNQILYYKYNADNPDADFKGDYTGLVADNIIEDFISTSSFKNSPHLKMFELFTNETYFNKLPELFQKLTSKFPEEEPKIERIHKSLISTFSPENNKFPTELTQEQKRMVIDKILSDNQYGVFFRTVHRIIKIISSFSHRNKLRRKYCGILRTQLSEQQLLLLFYNAEYSKRGKKFKKIVKNLNLWGDLNEIPSEPELEPTHFARKSLIWPKDDIEILRSTYSRNKNNLRN